MKKIEKKARKSNSKSRVEATMEMLNGHQNVGSRLALIQELIPLGLLAVEDILQKEVIALAGGRYRRGNKLNHRWGSNIGFVHLGHQKHSILVPRVRNVSSEQEVPLKERGLKTTEKILFIIDGAKGLRKGIETVFEKQAMIQRCQPENKQLHRIVE